MPQRVPHALDGDAIENLLEEATHNHANRFPASETAGHGVKNQFLVDLAGRRTVGATHVVGFDLQARNGIRSGMIAEQQIIVALVAVRFLSRG